MLAVHEDERAERPPAPLERLLEPSLQGRLGHGHAGARVAQQELDLLGWARHVDRERHGAEMQGRRVEQMELDAVRQEQRERVAAPEPERVQSFGQPAHALAVLMPADARGMAGVGERDLVHALGGGALEGCAEGVVAERARGVCAGEGGGGGHAAIVAS